MRYLRVAGIIGLLVLSGALVYFNSPVEKSGENVRVQGISGSASSVRITRENLPAFLERTELVRDLDDKASIALYVYSDESGEKKVVEEYSISRGSVRSGLPEDADLDVLINEEIIENFGRIGLCGTIREGINTGDFGFSLRKDKKTLLWRYRNMNDYLGCVK